MKSRSERWVARQNWTRDQQKLRVIEFFRVRYSNGNYGRATAQEVANALEMRSPSYVKDILQEMQQGGILTVQEALHRVRKDGSQIMKSLYRPSQDVLSVEAYQNMIADTAIKQGKLF